MKRSKIPRHPLAISVLAGGLSSRMGRDKARLRFDGSTLLGHVRRLAGTLGVPVRIIRRDLVSRCGPLGGIYTALQSSRVEAEIFLACDMPFVSAEWLVRLRDFLGAKHAAAFTVAEGLAGFPFVIKATALPVIERLLAEKQFSLQALALALRAKRVRCPQGRTSELFNINTPKEWEQAQSRRGVPLRTKRTSRLC